MTLTIRKSAIIILITTVSLRGNRRFEEEINT